MNEPVCPDRSQFGALVSGELSPADETALRVHAAQCPTCAQELKSLASVVDALRAADLSRIDAEPGRPTPAANRNLELAIFDRISSERRKTRIRRVGGSIAAAVLLLMGIVGGLALRSTPSSDGLYVALSYPVGGKADVELTQRKWGTEIKIETTGIPAGATYGVWLERPDGSRVPAGSFTTVATKAMTLRFSSALQTDAATAIGMTDFVTKKEVRVLLSEGSTEKT